VTKSQVKIQFTVYRVNQGARLTNIFQKIRESASLPSQEALGVTNEAVAALDRLIAERV
jgi:hypothetical protein